MKKLLPLIFFLEAFFILYLLDYLMTATQDASSLLVRGVFFVATAVWFYVPGWICNGPPALVQFYPILACPLDFGRNWRDGKRILGDHKTLRGFLIGVLAGTFVGFLQGRTLEGLVLAFSGMTGDAVKSFFKRRADIAPGGRFDPWDRVDFLLGSMAGYSLVFGFKRELAFYALAVMLLVYPIHEFSDRLAVILGIKKNPW